ncbi:NAD-glutamate dehydrogenase [Beggiatoa leptomitoformis]|uniref:NAD-glutamate dehydrogenase n=1 Tax=Beggiatoa leptomitoformis TaxID=288004 RepID=A0A2N9YHN4_9GAMM|nr:NAD-glutamate dehydrogenase [Beggiatoa leptomitoformis]ALG67762.1 NAD-glutamate dehydrogenase [Beggiatoa leptomitoformis]AUI69994.1 NAD-glutamate dehydrogenase [Beggiatoa leptomitoformis]
MSLSLEVQATELLQKILTNLERNFPPNEFSQLKTFTEYFFNFLTPEDVLERASLIDLYGAVVSYWQFSRQRQHDEVKIRVFNPQFEQDGWQSPHTIISILTRDRPFLVDSVQMALTRLNMTIHLIAHPILRVERDKQGNLQALYSLSPHQEEGCSDCYESIMHIEIDRHTDLIQLEKIQQSIASVLQTLKSAVDDWEVMKTQMSVLIEELTTTPPVGIAREEVTEATAFLAWLQADRFTFLGYREYKLVKRDGEDELRVVAGSGLGILREESAVERSSKGFTELPPALRQLARQPQLLLLTKANSRSTIHRASYMDYIGVKRFNEQGEVIGERRFVGLYTATLYHLSTAHIPFLQRKVQQVVTHAGYRPNSHQQRKLLTILETYPRDELLQMDATELFQIVTGILKLQERQRVRLFVRPDTYRRFYSCLVFAPRDRYDSAVRERMQAVLLKTFQGNSIDSTVNLSESALAQVHLVVHTDSNTIPRYDVKEIETQLVDIISGWEDVLNTMVLEMYGEEKGTQLFRRYRAAFPSAYREHFNPRHAAHDAEKLERLRAGEPLVMHLYKPLEALDNSLRFKLFHLDKHISLSDVLPMLENMGVKVISEDAYEIHLAAEPTQPTMWIQDFGLTHMPSVTIDIKQLNQAFQETFKRVWQGDIENDGFNRLVLHPELNWRDIVTFRAYYKYIRQAGSSFSQSYIEQTLFNNLSITCLLSKLFHARCNPEQAAEIKADVLLKQLETALDSVVSLDEDRILRKFLAVIQATLRTNFFQKEANGEPKPYLSFKVNPHKIPDLPEPRPLFEIFVYSPRMEGIHLRGGKVARGGIRWSDRLEDFRTEVLGLVKAQMVKNAIIVPVGSKGGFVCKRPPTEGGREAMQAEGIACYKTLIRGLLDLTDNLVDNKIVPPPHVLRHDDDDPYLVVAADKGTATFSDIANGLAKEYGFWLGDAFASGGSAGYDHKKMGITARGAWESVKRHFRELGIDTQTQNFTVVGIGDMSGDVFGNGLLLSPHICLVAAFNHQHIFLDPNPDPDTSYVERQRLFALPRSTWGDYNNQLISKGGGIHSRTVKSIVLTPEVRTLLGIQAYALTPNELIRALLCAPIDLLWNGGIGTYVKASTEHHSDVGDRTNDNLRVNGQELRCKVVGEGGNLGFTQRGRIEYALTGGRLNTDAIDNSGGVDCSDHEVNIKILLNAIVSNGDMTAKQRDQLLVDMTESVAQLVLRNNYLQTQARSLSLLLASSLIDVHARFIRELESKGQLARELEFLPTDKTIAERRAQGIGLTAPEIAILIAYSKITIYDALLSSDVPDDPYLHTVLCNYFPTQLPERFDKEIREHRLHREIVATELTNMVVNRGSSVFSFLLQEGTGFPVADTVRAFRIAWDIFDMKTLWTDIESLDGKITTDVQYSMMLDARKLVDRVARWLLRNHRAPLNMQEMVSALRPGVKRLTSILWDIIVPQDRQLLADKLQLLVNAGIPLALAQRVVSLETNFSTLDIVEVTNATSIHFTDEDAFNQRLAYVGQVHFLLGTRLQLHWLRDCMTALPRDNRWSSLARASLRDELFRTHRELTLAVLAQETPDNLSADVLFEKWKAQNILGITRSLALLADLSHQDKMDLAMLSVALREIRSVL